MTKLNKEAILEWVEALESGRYQQTTGTLAQYEKDGSVGYCCLGVACDVFKDRLGLEVDTNGNRITFDHTLASLPVAVAKFLGLSVTEVFWNKQERYVQLAQLNDTYNLTFQEIAAILRANFLSEETHD